MLSKIIKSDCTRHTVSDDYTVELYTTEITIICWCNLYAYSDTFCQDSDRGWKETCGNVLHEWKHPLLCGVWGYTRCSLQQATERPSLFFNSLAFNITALCTWSLSGCGCSARRRSSEPGNTPPSAAAAAPDHQRCWNHQTAGTGPGKERRRLPPQQNLCKYEASGLQTANRFIFTTNYTSLLTVCARVCASANFDWECFSCIIAVVTRRCPPQSVVVATLRLLYSFIHSFTFNSASLHHYPVSQARSRLCWGTFYGRREVGTTAAAITWPMTVKQPFFLTALQLCWVGKGTFK